VERDVRRLINIKDLDQFQKFLVLLAGRIGQVVNYTSLGNDIGLSGTSVKNWISVLKASYIVFELQPFFENVSKRVIKSSKIYFTDTGLVSHLLGIETLRQAMRDPLRGNLYENLMILEVLKARANQGKRPDLFFYRDVRGNEVDLIIQRQRQLIPVEIKSSATFNNIFLKGITTFSELTRDRCLSGHVLYNGERAFKIQGIAIYNLLLHGLPQEFV
jgi:predicted AAA+ superfamily ATPase